MTDATPTAISVDAAAESRLSHTSSAAKGRLAQRYASERRFRTIGLAAVLAAGAFLVLLLSTIILQALPAFTAYNLRLPIALQGEAIDTENPARSNFRALIHASLDEALPFAQSRNERRVSRALLAQGADVILREAVVADPTLIGATASIALPMSDTADLYLKGLVAEKEALPVTGAATPSAASGEITIAVDAATLAMVRLAAPIGAVPAADGSVPFSAEAPSHIVRINGGAVKVTAVDATQLRGETLIPLANAAAAEPGTWAMDRIPPEAGRQVSDREIVYADRLVEAGVADETFNWIFFTRGASREPEMAGILGAVVGSFLTMLVTFALSFPIAIGAAIYLEEFAPKNRFTDLVEVNINNLAAVPSIVFGLLGLAVFLNVFGVPRSAPIAGGMVLSLMTLPIIIIASRAALKAVPPSIRQAALGIGASRLQAVFHHVLPLALPGILTGTIIGMALAVGETAPLLMIGMVAFIVDIPDSFFEPATLLPVQIFMWADFPEAAFRMKTSAAILVLLTFLVAMNAIAILLRRRFERRW